MSCRTLIVGTPRSGTSSLLRAFGASNGFKRYGEPWNHWLSEKVLPFPYEFEKNCNVKTLIHTLPKEFINKPLTEFYDNLLPEFDNVILLGRRNFKEQLESYTYQLEKDKLIKERPKVLWQKTYAVDIELPVDNYAEELQTLRDLLEELSKSTGIPLTWYEDIFTEDSSKLDKFVNKFKGIYNKQAFFDKLNPQHRLRKNSMPLI